MKRNKKVTRSPENGKRLFVVTHPKYKTRRSLEQNNEVFRSKVAAKRRRDELRQQTGDQRYHVSKGPDHIGNHGGGTRHPRMQRNRKS